MVLTCLTHSHTARTKKTLLTLASTRALPAQRSCTRRLRPAANATASAADDALIHPRRDTHDPLARRMYHTVDQNRKQDPGPPRRRLSFFLSSSLLLHPALYSRQARSEDSKYWRRPAAAAPGSIGRTASSEPSDSMNE